MENLMDLENLFSKKLKIFMRATLKMDFLMDKIVYMRHKNTNTQVGFQKVKRTVKEFCKSNKNIQKTRNFKKCSHKSMKEYGRMIDCINIWIFLQLKNDINFSFIFT